MEKISFDLSGKVALVTGGTQGIGLAIAEALAQFGAKICINGRNKEKLETCKKHFHEKGVNLFTLVMDVTREEEVEKGIAIIEKEVGSIDILVNNAGMIKRVPILDHPVSDFRQVIEVDLVAPYMLSKAVAPSMIRRGGGKIINICSLMSFVGRNTISSYASAKGGLKMLTESMCIEWAKYHINVNGIAPGYIATELTAPIREGGHPLNDLVMTRTPAGRWGEPSELGGTAVLLASDAGKFINGQVIIVDGGIMANFGYVKGENEV